MNGEPLERARPQARWPLKTLTVLVLLVLYVPLITMVVGSFLVSASEPGAASTIGIENYLAVFKNSDLLNALGLSLIVGLTSTLISTIIGTMGALALERHQFAGKKLLSALTLFPLVMPELVMGLSLLIWFVFLHLTLGTVSIILAHVTFCLSYVTVIVRTRLKGFDAAVEEAAADLGATPWRTFWTVTFPLIFPGILAGALVAFTLSFDDFLITFYTAGVGSETLPLRLYSMIRIGISPELSALSTLLLALTIVVASSVFKPKRSARAGLKVRLTNKARHLRSAYLNSPPA
jgi:spermidine/putrescine transport system permease protein